MDAPEAYPGSSFWREAFALRGAATARVVPRALVFGAFAAIVSLVHRAYPGLAIRPDVIEASGLVLGLLLVFRTAAGYERWWEARRLWGGILNQSRNLVVGACANGPADEAWQRGFRRWVAAFAHAVRGTLQAHRQRMPELEALLGAEEAGRVASAAHMPTYVARRIAGLLRQACESQELDRFAFLQLERDRAALIDHAGACERILHTPIPSVYSITIRRFVVVYLLALPFALVASVGLSSPAYALFIAYPILSLEQIGAELQNPFVTRSLSHLELEQLCVSIETSILELDRRPGDCGPRS